MIGKVSTTAACAALALADAGELRNFPGVTAKYEPPNEPNLVLDATDQSIDQCADAVIALLRENGFIK